MISQTAEYALRAIAFLATRDDVLTSRRDIAEAAQVPQDYLTKVMQELDRAGIVTSQRGPGGGYALSVEPEELTVFDVVSVIAPVPRLRECPLGIKDHTNLCPLHKKLDEAAELVEQAFKGTTIAELIPGRSKAARCTFPQQKNS